MPIPFTQYLLPNGRKQLIQLTCPARDESIAKRFIASGGRYECEVLTTGQVSLTAVKRIGGHEGDVAIVICRNAPNILVGKVGELVRQSEPFIDAQ